MSENLKTSSRHSSVPAALEETEEENKFLTFLIGDEQYGVGIAYVTEIIEMIKITPIPDMNAYIKGVINLRGKVIPVMDVRLRFSMAERAHDPKTCVIVVNIDGIQVGLIVDTVCEVVDIPPRAIAPPPQMHRKTDQHYIAGIGRINDEVSLLLDLTKLLFDDEMQKLAQTI